MFDTLQSFAEVGIAVAGFSGIAAALGTARGVASADSRRRFLLTLLETAGMVVLFSFVPQILNEIALPGANLWRTSAGLYAGAHAFHGILLFRRVRRFGTPKPDIPKSIVPIGLVVLGLQLASVIFGSIEQVRFVYLLALCWHTIAAATSFAGLLLSSLKQDAVKPQV